MHPIRKRRLCYLLVLLAFLSMVVMLVLYAIRQNISLFYTPSQVHEGHAPTHMSVRIGGMVKQGSVHRGVSGQHIYFEVTDFKHEVQVKYDGMLPDLFREGQGVVVDGQLTNKNQLIATEVLAKHDATYMPPAIRDMVKRNSKQNVG